MEWLYLSYRGPVIAQMSLCTHAVFSSALAALIQIVWTRLKFRALSPPDTTARTFNSLPPPPPPVGNFHAFLSSADFFFQNQLLRKIISGMHVSSECQTDWIQIRLDVLSGPDLDPNCLQNLAADTRRKS